MIQQTSFLGFSLRTRTRRRALVLVYYSFILMLMAVCLYRHRFLGAALTAQTFVLGSFFGGIRAGSIVKPYSERIPDPDRSPLQSLNLGPVRPTFGLTLLDERECQERDRAHYLAYRLLIAIVGVSFALLIIVMVSHPAFLSPENSVSLFWVLTLVVMSLPQSVILWTEAEPIPDSTLTLMENPAR